MRLYGFANNREKKPAQETLVPDRFHPLSVALHNATYWCMR